MHGQMLCSGVIEALGIGVEQGVLVIHQYTDV